MQVLAILLSLAGKYIDLHSLLTEFVVILHKVKSSASSTLLGIGLVSGLHQFEHLYCFALVLYVSYIVMCHKLYNKVTKPQYRAYRLL